MTTESSDEKRAMRWVKIDCDAREVIVSRNGERYEGLGVAAGRTDMDGQYGEPCIFTEWYDRATDQSVLQDYLWPARRHSDDDLFLPDVKPCEHYEWRSR